MFNIHNDYVTLQEQDFRVPKRVADEQHPWTISKQLEQPVLQLFIYALAEVTKFESAKRLRARQVVSIDFQIANIHTRRYVTYSQEEAKVP